MVSRPNKAPSKPLAVAGRYKPMKVEKAKKPRTHKVKQGTPPKLSESQIRKLVRLYVLTNLSWKDISTLVLHYGRKDIKKRALQYTLRGLLSDQYNEMRPKNASARRGRASQMQTYLDMRHSKNSGTKALDETLQLLKPSLTHITANHVAVHPELNPGTTTRLSESNISVAEDQSYLNEFDRWIDASKTQDLDVQLLSNEGVTLHDPSVSTVDQGAYLLPQRPYGAVESPSTTNLFRETELEPFVRKSGETMRGTCSEEQLHELDETPGWPTADSWSPFLLPNEYLGTYDDFRVSIQNHSQEPRLSGEPSYRPRDLMRHTEAPSASGYSAFSNLSALVDRFSKCSEGFGMIMANLALGATFDVLQDIIDKGASIHVLNTAQQTFMHLLNPLNMMQKNFNFDQRDVRGHTFIQCSEARGGVLSKYPTSRPTSLVNNLRKGLYHVSSTADSSTASVVPPLSDTWNKAWSNSGCSVVDLLRVPKTALRGLNQFEDVQGRNLLHIAAGKMPADVPDVSMLSFSSKRHTLVEDLVNVGVDIDHHDNWGEPPLMTHIRTLPPQDDIILELLHSHADLNARNHKGEAALHISIKLGDIISTEALFAQHASLNVHVRDWQGQGVLVSAARAQRHAKHDVGPYARVTTCIALAIDAGAIMEPTVFDEWDLRDPARDILRKAGYIMARGS
ncbi:MAG: hypothetical protein Q9169_003705 [Polycauliona sp. 2 TL-2023]